MDNENIHICIKLDLFLKKIKMVQSVIFQDIKHQAATKMKGKKKIPPQESYCIIVHSSSYEHVVLTTHSSKMLDYTQILLSQEQQLPGFYQLMLMTTWLLQWKKAYFTIQICSQGDKGVTQTLKYFVRNSSFFFFQQGMFLERCFEEYLMNEQYRNKIIGMSKLTTN